MSDLISVDEATVELEAVRLRVAKGKAGINDLVRAQGMVDVARLVEVEQAHVAEIRASQANVAEAEQLVGWFGGDEHRQLHVDAVAAYRRVVDAQLELLAAWAALRAARRPRFSRLRALGQASMPEGVTVDARFGLDCAVSTPSGTWTSDALYYDVGPMPAEHAKLLHSGRQPRADLARRLADEWRRGTGRDLLAGNGHLSDTGDDDPGPRAA